MRRWMSGTTRPRSRPSGSGCGASAAPTRRPAHGARGPYYTLMMFPYPSAEGLHVGPRLRLPRASTSTAASAACRATTSSSRSASMPSASTRKTTRCSVGTNPKQLIPKTIDNFRRQLSRLGLMVDWDHAVDTTVARLLPLDAVDLPAALQARPGGAQEIAGELVPELSDRARQRAGDRRLLRAPPGHARRAAPDRAVVLHDHPVRRAPADQPRLDRLVGDHQDGAAQLDRPFRRRADRLSAGG